MKGVAGFEGSLQPSQAAVLLIPTSNDFARHSFYVRVRHKAFHNTQQYLESIVESATLVVWERRTLPPCDQHGWTLKIQLFCGMSWR